MSFSEQKAPTSLPCRMGATGLSPTMHLVLERMQSAHAIFLPKSAFSWSQEPAREAGNVFSPMHPRSALPPSFSSAGISSIAIHGRWEGFRDCSLGGPSALESHQPSPTSCTQRVLTHVGRDHLPPHTSYQPWKWRCLPSDPADTQLPGGFPSPHLHLQTGIPIQWPPGSSLCFAYQSPTFPKGIRL